VPGQGRLGDKAQVPLDAHGCPACPHPGVGPAIGGSFDVRVNGRPALRVGDPGMHTACCGANRWSATAGSATVFINGKSAHRMGDETRHCGGRGQLIEGSPNVMVGEATSAGRAAGRPSERRTTMAATSASAGASAADADQREAAHDGARQDVSDRERASRIDAPTQQRTDFIELELVDEQGRPMANERYLVTASDGGVRAGRLDSKGFARIEGVAPGTCKVQFPDRHAGDWGRA
jgi:uncharacterized Zn-binding protein involved in type VI secretion